MIETECISRHDHDMNEEIGKNQPCSCGSGKKYKKCCGSQKAESVNRSPAIDWTLPESTFDPTAMKDFAQEGGFDPSQMDPKKMQQLQRMMKSLPKGQLSQLQNLVQQAMAGKDVTDKLKDLEGKLPPDLRNAVEAMAPEAEAATDSMESSDMSVDQARKIVEDAVREGKLSRVEADKLLAAQKESGAQSSSPDQKKGVFGKLFSKK